MFRKQKINAISLILSKGLAEIYPHIQSPQTFSEQEKKGKAIDYINSLNDLSSKEKRKLCAYYKVSTEIVAKYMNRHVLVLTSDISDLGAYTRAVNRGIADVKEVLEDMLKEDNIPNRLKIMELVNAQIKLISDNIEDLSLLLNEYEITDHTLAKAFKNEDSLSISYEILRRINPNHNRGLLKIWNKNLQDAVTEYMFRELAMELVDEFGKAKARVIYGDLEQRLKYLTSDADPDPEHLANLALMLAQFPIEAFQKEEVYIALRQLAHRYKKCIINDVDVATLIDIYEFLIKNQRVIVGHAPKRVQQLMGSIYNDAADLYSLMWEKEKAIAYYKKFAQMNPQNERFNIERTIMNITELLEKRSLDTELVDFLFNVVTDTQSALNLDYPFELSKSFQLLFEQKIILLIQSIELPNEKLKWYKAKFRNESSSQLFELLVKFLKEDEIKTDELQAVIKQLEKDTREFGVGSNSMDDICENYFGKWRISDPKLKELKDGLLEIGKDMKGIQKNANKLTYQFFLAKLEYHKNNKKSIETYRNLIENPAIIFNNYATHLSDYFDTEQVQYWYQAYLRALTLGVRENKELQDEIKKYVKKILDLAIVEYYEDYKNPNALVFIQSTVDQCIRCVSDCIKETNDNNNLYHLLWSILLFKQDIIFWRSDKSNFLNQNEFSAKLLNLKKSLAEYYIYDSKSEDQISLIEDNAYEIKRFQLPAFKKNSFFNLKALPLKTSIIFHIFTKENEEQSAIILTYFPNRNEPQEIGEFRLNTLNFQKIVETIGRLQEEEDLRWINEGEGFALVVQDLDTRNFLYQELLPSMHLSNRLASTPFFELPEDQTDCIDLYLSGILFQMPFELLCDNNCKPFGLLNSLATVLYKPQKELYIDKSKTILVFAEVPTIYKYKFKYLPATKRERLTIEKVCQLNNVSCSSFTDKHVNTTNFKEYLLNKKISILHIAMHGVTDISLLYDAAALVMYPTDEQNLETALLTYHDILQLNLSNIDLVILSGCNTATGEAKKGSPMQGLAYAFLASGVKSVVASRLTVRDESANLMMNKFYEYLLTNNFSVQNAFRLLLKHFYYTESIVNLRDLASWALYT